jgi:hypothetical protein
VADVLLARETDDKSLVVLLVSGAIFALTAIFWLTGRKSSELRGRDFVEVRERLIKMFFGACVWSPPEGSSALAHWCVGEDAVVLAAGQVFSW